MNMCKLAVLTVAALLLLCLHDAHSAAVGDLVVEKEQATATEQQKSTKVAEDCHQPKETGRCFALFYRYAYNLDTRACEEFIYGGCAGNKNNFESKEQCEQICLGKNADAPAETTIKNETDESAESSTPGKA